MWSSDPVVNGKHAERMAAHAIFSHFYVLHAILRQLHQRHLQSHFPTTRHPPTASAPSSVIIPTRHLLTSSAQSSVIFHFYKYCTHHLITILFHRDLQAYFPTILYLHLQTTPTHLLPCLPQHTPISNCISTSSVTFSNNTILLAIFYHSYFPTYTIY